MAIRPRLCGLPTVKGRLKELPEDFEVEEIPAYLPCGEGDHRFFWIEKRGLTTRQATQRLGELLGTDARSMGTAGMKDRHAVTRQWISAEHVDAEKAEGHDDGALRVLRAVAHTAKLRTGHLRGNRFRIRVRGVPDARPILEEGERLAGGVPNYFGAQRFGKHGDNAEVARRWLVDGAKAPRDRFKRKLYVSALQSAAFNDVLASRVQSGHVHQVLAGDICMTQRGGIFSDDDLDALQARVASWEVSPTGPMFGASMRRAGHDAGALEARVEEDHGLDDAAYERMGKLGKGTRRPLRIRPEDLHFEACEDGFIAQFTLPKGAYATVVLAEVLQ